MAAGLGDRKGATAQLCATAAMVSLGLAVTCLLLLHALKPELTPARHMISEYALGRHGWVMVVCFLAMASGCLSLFLGLAMIGPGSVSAWIGTSLLGVASVGLIVSAVFPMDAPAAPATTAGDIHDLSFLVNVISIVSAALAFSVGPRLHPAWRGHRRTALSLTILMCMALAAQFLTLRRGAPFGLANRVFALALMAWLTATSFRLSRCLRG